MFSQFYIEKTALFSIKNANAFEHVFDLVTEELHEMEMNSQDDISFYESVYFEYKWVYVNTRQFSFKMFYKEIENISLQKKNFVKLLNFLEIMKIHQFDASSLQNLKKIFKEMVQKNYALEMLESN